MEYLKEIVDYATLGILGVMSIIVVGVSLERISFYSGTKPTSYETKNSLEEALTKNLTVISLIGSNAPYIGLLGTVGGIMVVFYEMGMSGGMEPAKVVVGLSLALKATALGLLIAIPSTMVYGAFLRKTDVLIGRWEDEIVKAG